jgi:hypothetical protein
MAKEGREIAERFFVSPQQQQRGMSLCACV